MYLVVPAKNVGMSNADAEELVRQLNDKTPYVRDRKKAIIIRIEVG